MSLLGDWSPRRLRKRLAHEQARADRIARQARLDSTKRHADTIAWREREDFLVRRDVRQREDIDAMVDRIAKLTDLLDEIHDACTDTPHGWPEEVDEAMSYLLPRIAAELGLQGEQT